MNFDYVVAKRTKGANPFHIFEELGRFDPDGLAMALRKIDYSAFLETSYWFAVSHVCKARAGMRCQVCNGNTNIAAHHRTYDTHGKEHLHMNDLVVLCEYCHGLFHGHMAPRPRPVVHVVHSPAPTVPIPQRETKQERRERRERLRAERGEPLKKRGPKIIPHSEEEIGMPDGDSFVLTHDLINACRANGSFTTATLVGFGFKAFPRSGWVQTLIGKTLTRAEYRAALEGRFIYSLKFRSLAVRS